jgi:TolB-like protein/Tfp pilus assembly protein PilF
LTYWGFPLLVLAVLAGFALFKFYFDTDIGPASIEKMAFSLPDKPSIAVLPFKNVSGDSEQEYFSDGMTDDLITDLSKISGLFVIARNSAFTYKGKPIKIEQVARELGVRYVLEGSVRRAKNQVRINAQLIDAKSGTHLWAERYDDEMDDIFTLQDRITNKIVTALAVKLTPNEKDLISRKGTDCIEAYDAFLKGEGHFLRWTREDTRKAVPYLKEAIELDPNYGRAYATLGLLYWNAPQTWSGVQWPKGKLLARSCLNSAMKNPGPYAHRLAAWIKLRLRLYDEAISEAEQALALAPNDPAIHEVMANVLYCAGRPKEAVEYAKYFMRHDPRRLHLGLFHQGLFYFSMRKFEQAANFFERSITHSPEGLSVYLNLAVCYVHLGRKKEAREAINNYYKRLGWEPSLPAIMYFYPFKDPNIDKLFADGLLEAGIKGEPSGYYKILEENRLDGEEIRQLLFGQKLRRWCPRIDNRDITRTEDGTIMCRSDEVGKSRIEGDMLCEKWNARFDGLEYCGTVFRNPEGFFDTKDEYLHVTDFEICWLSPYER